MPLDINYHHLYYFWICVRAGSLTAASRELHLSQSALSLQLKSLERAMGRRLLDRTRTGVTPTPDGLVVFERCERIFPEGEALSRELRTGARSIARFRIGAAAGLGREFVLRLFARIEGVPHLLPTVLVAPSPELTTALQRRQLDVAVFATDPSSSLGALFRARPIATDSLRFVASPKLVRTLGPFPRRGREYPMLLRPAQHPLREKIRIWMDSRGLSMIPVAETSDVDLLRVLAAQGRGIAALGAESVKDDLDSGRLVRVPGAPTDLNYDVWAAAAVRPPADESPRLAVERIMSMGGER
ncbi:MAG: LysR family transcriptional regulator [Elusimicrobia bacterium]|nr:LysR family transcriptional regulator [Elusimicrobiota bacterium]